MCGERRGEGRRGESGEESGVWRERERVVVG